jgi:hypothetical protein
VKLKKSARAPLLIGDCWALHPPTLDPTRKIFVVSVVRYFRNVERCCGDIMAAVAA